MGSFRIFLTASALFAVTGYAAEKPAPASSPSETREAAPARTRRLEAEQAAKTEDIQHSFFPEVYEYTVGDFVLSLPVGYDEEAMQRLAFAKNILQNAYPKPAEQQKRYLVLPEQGENPRREFLLLDQHHLFAFIHAAEEGDPSKNPDIALHQITVLERHDATWTDISARVLPAWALRPTSVTIDPATGKIRVKSAKPTHSSTLQWNGSTFRVR